VTQSEERKKLFAEARAELQARHLANSDAFDKAVLALSTVFLGLSIGFLKDFIPLHLAQWQGVLVFSWLALVASVVLTVVSFFLGQQAALTQLEYAQQYYLEEKDEYLTKKNPQAIAAEWVDRVSAGAFVLAVVATVLFVVVNLEGAGMVSRNKAIQDATQTRAAKPLPLTPVSSSQPTGTSASVGASQSATGSGTQSSAPAVSSSPSQVGSTPASKK